MIEAKLEDGKLFWRSTDPNGPHSKNSSAFVYDDITCFRLSRELFFLFKNSGKRKGDDAKRPTRAFDVATRQELNDHGKSHREFDHVHIPSLNKLRAYAPQSETTKDWAAIALPTAFHKKVSRKIIRTPFYDEMNFYLKLADSDSLLLMLGAFRNLLRLQTKGKAGPVPALFFKSDDNYQLPYHVDGALLKHLKTL